MRAGRSRAWITMLVAGVFVAWSVVLPVQVAAMQREVVERAGTVRLLGRLTENVTALEDVVLGYVGGGVEVRRLTGEWDAVAGRLRDDRLGLETTLGGTGTLAEIDRRLAAMTEVRGRIGAALAVGRPTRSLEHEMRQHRRAVTTAAWRTADAERDRLGGLSAALASRWTQINALVIVSCVMAFALALGTAVHRRVVRRAGVSEDARRESDRRLRLVAEHAGEAFWMVSADEREVLYVSPGYERIMGQPCRTAGAPDECLGTVHPDDRQRLIDARARSTDPAAEQRDHEVRVLLPDGTVRWVWLRSRPIRDDHGTIVARVGAAADITRRRSAETHAQRLGRAVEQSIDGVAIADVAGKVTFVNQAWADMHQVRAETQTGRHLSVYHTPEQWRRDVRPFVRKLEAKGSHEGEVRHVRADGTTLPTHMSVTILRDDAGAPVGYVVVARDVAGRIRQQEELRRRAERERRLLRELAHRVRANLRSLETLVDLTADASGDPRAVAGAIQGRVRAMSRVHELLTTSRWMPVTMRQLVESLTPERRAAPHRDRARAAAAVGGGGDRGRGLRHRRELDRRRMIQVLTPPGCLRRPHPDGPEVPEPVALSTAPGGPPCGADHRLSIALSGSGTSPVAATR